MKLPKDFFKEEPVTAWGSHWSLPKLSASEPGIDDAPRETVNEFTGIRLRRQSVGDKEQEV